MNGSVAYKPREEFREPPLRRQIPYPVDVLAFYDKFLQPCAVSDAAPYFLSVCFRNVT